MTNQEEVPGSTPTEIPGDEQQSSSERFLRLLKDLLDGGDTDSTRDSDECSIRFSTKPATCLLCEGKVGSGPVGWLGDRGTGGAICDRCLCARSPQLGLLLVTALLFRHFGNPGGSNEEKLALLTLVAAFARLYHHATNGVWPLRPIFLGSSAEELLVEGLLELVETLKGKMPEETNS